MISLIAESSNAGVDGDTRVLRGNRSDGRGDIWTFIANIYTAEVGGKIFTIFNAFEPGEDPRDERSILMLITIQGRRTFATGRWLKRSE